MIVILFVFITSNLCGDNLKLLIAEFISSKLIPNFSPTAKANKALYIKA
jgi:hypothetical protein